MRISKAQAQENREKVVATASRLFRAQGIDGVAVGELMKASGFTHGGFYNHFASKEALAAEALDAVSRASQLEMSLRQAREEIARLEAQKAVIADLEKKLEAAEGQANAARAQVAAAQSAADEAKVRLIAAEGAAAKMQSLLDSSEGDTSAVDAARAEAESLRWRNRYLESRASHLEKVAAIVAAAPAVAAIAPTEAVAVSVDQSVAALHDSWSQRYLEARRAHLETRVNAIQTEAQKQADAAAKAQAENVELRDKIAKLAAEHSGVLRERDQLQPLTARVAQLQTQVQQLDELRRRAAQAEAAVGALIERSVQRIREAVASIGEVGAEASAEALRE